MARAPKDSAAPTSRAATSSRRTSATPRRKLPPGPGRPPPRLTECEPQIRKLLGYLRKGHYLITAIKLSGIPKATVYHWIELGGRAKTGVYRRFLDRIERAEAEGEDRHLGFLDKLAAASDRQAAEFILERRHHQRWGRRTFRIEDGGPPVEGGGKVVQYEIRLPQLDPLPPKPGEAGGAAGLPAGSAREATGCKPPCQGNDPTGNGVDGGT